MSLNFENPFSLFYWLFFLDVTLALKTCTSLARLSLVKESLKSKTAFGGTEKQYSQQENKQTTKIKNKKTTTEKAGTYVMQPFSLQSENYVSVHIALRLLWSVQCLKDCFIFGYYLDSG